MFFLISYTDNRHVCGVGVGGGGRQGRNAVTVVAMVSNHDDAKNYDNNRLSNKGNYSNKFSSFQKCV
jgi:hypothetical protein